LGWLCLVCSLITVAEEVTPQNARQWLNAMIESMQHLDYQATVVYSRDNRIRLFRLAHQVRDGVIYEHLQSLSDPLRKVVREADKVTCYFPDRRTLVEYHNRSDSLFTAVPSQWGGQELYYRVEMGRQGHTVGRPSQEILIRPLDKYRYGRRIWLDGATHLPLKFELLDQQGNTLESFAVTDLKLGRRVQHDTDDPTSHKDWKILKHQEKKLDRRWQLTRLPKGFKELHRSRRTEANEGGPVDHILISDGLTAVSVYIREHSGVDLDPGNLKRGSVSVFRRSIKGHVITVVGDVPMITVRMIGEGLREEE